MDETKTLDEQYDEYAEFLRNDPEEQKIQRAKKERRAKRERERLEEKWEYSE